MAEWKIIIGSEPRTVKPVGKDTQERDTVYHQIITCDQYGFLIGDYEIITEDKVKFTLANKLPANVVEIEGVYYQERTDKKFMEHFNGIIDVYVRNWKQQNPPYDITNIKLAVKYFKELIELKNELLMLNPTLSR